MADVKKIATRDSYGNALKELAAEGLYPVRFQLCHVRCGPCL